MQGNCWKNNCSKSNSILKWNCSQCLLGMRVKNSRESFWIKLNEMSAEIQAARHGQMFNAVNFERSSKIGFLAKRENECSWIKIWRMKDNSSACFLSSLNTRRLSFVSSSLSNISESLFALLQCSSANWNCTGLPVGKQQVNSPSFHFKW